MSIRTGKGDEGRTDLASGKNVRKDDIRVAAIGDLDELNCFLGLAKVRLNDGNYRSGIEIIQRKISVISSELSSEGVPEDPFKELSEYDMSWIESFLRETERGVDMPEGFIVPGDNELSALLHTARAVTRRAERTLVTLLKGKGGKAAEIISFVNCLSDLLFVMAVKFS